MWLEAYMDAVKLAVEAHHGQTRFNKEPYVLHPMRVSKHIMALTGDLRLAIAGVCHDILEDTKITEEQLSYGFFHPINREILRLVKALTKDASLSKVDKEAEFLERFKRSDTDVVIIKLADRYDNVSDLSQQSAGFQERYKTNTLELLKAVPHPGHPIVRQLMNEIILKAQIDLEPIPVR